MLRRLKDIHKKRTEVAYSFTTMVMSGCFDLEGVQQYLQVDGFIPVQTLLSADISGRGFVHNFRELVIKIVVLGVIMTVGEMVSLYMKTSKTIQEVGDAKKLKEKVDEIINSTYNDKPDNNKPRNKQFYITEFDKLHEIRKILRRKLKGI